MFQYWKSKESIVTTVFQFQMFLLKKSSGITKKLNFKIRMIKSNSDFCYSSAYWELVYTKTIKQSDRVCKLIAWSVYPRNTALTMPILSPLHYFYIQKSVIYKVFQSKHILHLIGEDIKTTPKHSRKKPHKWITGDVIFK